MWYREKKGDRLCKRKRSTLISILISTIMLSSSLVSADTKNNYSPYINSNTLNNASKGILSVTNDIPFKLGMTFQEALNKIGEKKHTVGIMNGENVIVYKDYIVLHFGGLFTNVKPSSKLLEIQVHPSKILFNTVLNNLGDPTQQNMFSSGTKDNWDAYNARAYKLLLFNSTQHSATKPYLAGIELTPNNGSY
ncbi:hypothetical protein PP175_18060 [Aneurinibacillus sp. Ricciae_BoGa-3]|uniref:hypothetical protein n=1 Tax=Aneurinibacillus sp. Ricciae_BoGa-3 TaxID=3022697 RepID=UPI00234046DF|nr:hypothetical protein [Aneurinibacillus sp. Ricciae_BoGa-3]WCK53289.1 hypothetical protein PP175_18060 [Aneurinibacillus sp. Ricciae_BoGa-3]